MIDLNTLPRIRALEAMKPEQARSVQHFLELNTRSIFQQIRAKISSFACLATRSSTRLSCCSRSRRRCCTLPTPISPSPLLRSLASTGVHQPLLRPECYPHIDRGIEAGEEIVLSYILPGHPYLRRRRLEEQELRCECLKCTLEQKLERELEEVNRCYRSPIARDAPPSGFKSGTDDPAMVVKLEGVLNSELESEEERQCLRSVHWPLYATYYELVSRGLVRRVESFVPGAEVIMAAAHKFSAGMIAVMFDKAEIGKHAGDKNTAEKILRDEWECRFGEVKNVAAYEAARNNPDLLQLLAT